MRVIKANAEIISEKNPFRKVEMAARTCYKSEAKITDESAEKMCKGLIKSQHTAMLEHAVFCFHVKPATITPENIEAFEHYIDDLAKTDYVRITTTVLTDPTMYQMDTRVLVSANARVISERGINDPLFRAVQEKYPGLVWGAGVSTEFRFYLGAVEAKIIDFDEVQDPTIREIGAHKALTFRFTTNRGVSHELVRHRLCSFAQESTRYCLYAKDQFGAELTFIEPADYDEWSEDKKLEHESFLQLVEKHYLFMVKGKDALKAQQARDDLTNGLKTEIVVTAHMCEWEHIFALRVKGATGAPHPDIKYVMEQALNIARKDKLAAKYLELL